MTETDAAETLVGYDRIHVRKRKDDKFMWEYLAAGNNATLATDGSQGYESDDACRAGAFRVCGVPQEGPVYASEHAFEDHGQTFTLPTKPRQLSDGSWLYPVRVPADG